jgi:tetratricopeptide (TPR) repeat protein
VLIRRIAVVTWLVAASAFASPQASRDAVQAGFTALQQGDADKAAQIFRTVLASTPGDPAVLYGAGIAAHLQGREGDALRFLKQALRAEPRLIQASALLGEIAYHQGDLDLAISTYEQALALAPGNVVLRERLAAWQAEAGLHHDFVAYKDDRFSILFDGPANQRLATRAASVLTAAFWRIGKALGAYPSDPINVILYTDRQFRDITGAPEWAGGGFDGQIRMPVRGAAQNLPQFDRVLTHELTHAMLEHIVSRDVPAWLNEGLAMYFDGNDAAGSERRLAAVHVFVKLDALHEGFGRLSAAQATVAYEVSAFAASALVARIGAANLGFLLQDLERGVTIEEAVERFGFTFDSFEADLARRVAARQP